MSNRDMVLIFLVFDLLLGLMLFLNMCASKTLTPGARAFTAFYAIVLLWQVGFLWGLRPFV